MPDFVNSISQLQAHSSDIEKARVQEQLRLLALQHFTASATGTTDGAGTWLTLWSGTVPTGATVGLRAQLVGRGSSLGALFEVAAGFQNFAGTTTYIGGTYSTTVNLSDNVLLDARWWLVGNLVALQVNDASLQAMNWSAYVEAVKTV